MGVVRSCFQLRDILFTFRYELGGKSTQVHLYLTFSRACIASSAKPVVEGVIPIGELPHNRTPLTSRTTYLRPKHCGFGQCSAGRCFVLCHKDSSAGMKLEGRRFAPWFLVSGHCRHGVLYDSRRLPGRTTTSLHWREPVLWSRFGPCHWASSAG